MRLSRYMLHYRPHYSLGLGPTGSRLVGRVVRGTTWILCLPLEPTGSSGSGRCVLIVLVMRIRMVSNEDCIDFENLVFNRTILTMVPAKLLRGKT